MKNILNHKAKLVTRINSCTYMLFDNYKYKEFIEMATKKLKKMGFSITAKSDSDNYFIMEKENEINTRYR
jgi:hypothetical protein